MVVSRPSKNHAQIAIFQYDCEAGKENRQAVLEPLFMRHSCNAQHMDGDTLITARSTCASDWL